MEIIWRYSYANGFQFQLNWPHWNSMVWFPHVNTTEKTPEWMQKISISIAEPKAMDVKAEIVSYFCTNRAAIIRTNFKNSKRLLWNFYHNTDWISNHPHLHVIIMISKNIIFHTLMAFHFNANRKCYFSTVTIFYLEAAQMPTSFKFYFSTTVWIDILASSFYNQKNANQYIHTLNRK